MPTPRIAQAPSRPAGPLAAASMASPAASTRLESASTLRPPRRSIALPTHGPTNAAIRSAIENAASTSSRDTAEVGCDRIGQDRRQVVARSPGQRLGDAERRDHQMARPGVARDGVVVVGSIMVGARAGITAFQNGRPT